jgi:chaperonin GroES
MIAGSAVVILIQPHVMGHVGACQRRSTLFLLRRSSMKVVPLGDKLVVKRLEGAEKTAGGIVLPDAARDKPQQGRVLSVGDGKLLPDGTRSSPEVQEGDRVVFSSYSGTEVKIDDQELLILSGDDVLAIVR